MSRLGPLGTGAADLAVDHLRLRVPDGGRREAIAELECAEWPRAPRDQWIIVRQLKVRAPRRRIGTQAAVRAGGAARAAVHGGDAAAAGANAVRFLDLDDLIAWLCADLAAGRAASLWYWRPWSRVLRLSIPDAIHQVLAEHPLRLGSVTRRLREIHALTAVWPRLTPQAVDDLRGRLSRETGLTLPGPSAGTAANGTRLPAPPADLVQRWAGTLSPMGPLDPRRWLAACLILMEWRPTWLGGGAEGRIAEVARVLGGGRPPAESMHAWHGSSAAEEAQQHRDPGSFSGHEPTDRHRPAAASPGRPAPQATQVSHRSPVSLEADRLGTTVYRPDPSVHDRHRGFEGGFAAGDDAAGGDAGAGTRLEAGDAHSAPALPDATGSTPTGQAKPAQSLQIRDTDGTTQPPPARIRLSPRENGSVSWDPDLHTREGGLFYLINFLDRPETRDLLAEQAAEDTPDDGWIRLWWLGAALGLAPDGAMARFLAGCIGLDDYSALMELPPWSLVPELSALGCALYADGGIWGPELLRVEARLRHTPTHLDVYLPLSSVRLEVRRAALDINPGWVPWLGRVVSFHYQGPEDWPCDSP